MASFCCRHHCYLTLRRPPPARPTYQALPLLRSALPRLPCPPTALFPCPPPGLPRPVPLRCRACRAVITAYFEEKGLVRQQLDSFNDFINTSLQEIVDEGKLITVGPQSQHMPGAQTADDDAERTFEVSFLTCCTHRWAAALAAAAARQCCWRCRHRAAQDCAAQQLYLVRTAPAALLLPYCLLPCRWSLARSTSPSPFSSRQTARQRCCSPRRPACGT